MAVIPAAGYMGNNARTNAEMQQAFEDLVASLRQLPGSAHPESYHIISTGTLTPPGGAGMMLVDTEGLAATDDLANVATTNYPDGSCLVMRNANLGRVVTVKHLAGGAGQLNLDRSVDYVLDDEKKWLMMQRRGADWHEVFRGPIRMTTLSVAKSAAFTVNKEDLGKTMLCTGTYTISLLAALAAGNGFVVMLRNVGTGTVTIDPNGAELIQGVSTLALLPGWSYVLVCDGTGWYVASSTGPQPAENPIVNGTMEVWQRGFSFTAVPDATYTADRWKWHQASSVVVTIVRNQLSVPTIAQAGVVFNYSLEVDITTADAAIATADYALLTHYVEGGVWRHFAQRQFTLSFWVLSSKIGVHCVSFRNNGLDRTFVSEYTVNAANTWEYKSVTVVASPSAGGWNYETGVGVNISFALAAGTTFQTTTGVWQIGNFLATANQVNVLDNAVNVFRITGVKMELGSVATPLDVVGFDMEYARCNRYYQKTFTLFNGPTQNAGTNSGEHIFNQIVGASTAFTVPTVHLVMPMRVAPTITLWNPNALNAQIRNRTNNTDCSGSGVYNVSEKSFTLQGTTPAGSASGNILAAHWTASADF